MLERTPRIAPAGVTPDHDPQGCRYPCCVERRRQAVDELPLLSRCGRRLDVEGIDVARLQPGALKKHRTRRVETPFEPAVEERRAGGHDSFRRSTVEAFRLTSLDLVPHQDEVRLDVEDPLHRQIVPARHRHRGRDAQTPRRLHGLDLVDRTARRRIDEGRRHDEIGSSVGETACQAGIRRRQAFAALEDASHRQCRQQAVENARGRGVGRPRAGHGESRARSSPSDGAGIPASGAPDRASGGRPADGEAR